MKKIICLVLLLVFCIPVNAASRVRGYYRPNGTYVQPHYRSNANYTRYDNYSTKGNYNPYTGAAGTQSPYKNYTGGYKRYRY